MERVLKWSADYKREVEKRGETPWTEERVREWVADYKREKIRRGLIEIQSNIQAIEQRIINSQHRDKGRVERMPATIEVEKKSAAEEILEQEETMAGEINYEIPSELTMGFSSDEGSFQLRKNKDEEGMVMVPASFIERNSTPKREEEEDKATGRFKESRGEKERNVVSTREKNGKMKYLIIYDHRRRKRVRWWETRNPWKWKRRTRSIKKKQWRSIEKFKHEIRKVNTSTRYFNLMFVLRPNRGGTGRLSKTALKKMILKSGERCVCRKKKRRKWQRKKETRVNILGYSRGCKVQVGRRNKVIAMMIRRYGMDGLRG